MTPEAKYPGIQIQDSNCTLTLEKYLIENLRLRPWLGLAWSSLAPTNTTPPTKSNRDDMVIHVDKGWRDYLRHGNDPVADTHLGVIRNTSSARCSVRAIGAVVIDQLRMVDIDQRSVADLRCGAVPPLPRFATSFGSVPLSNRQEISASRSV